MEADGEAEPVAVVEGHGGDDGAVGTDVREGAQSVVRTRHEARFAQYDLQPVDDVHLGSSAGTLPEPEERGPQCITNNSPTGRSFTKTMG